MQFSSNPVADKLAHDMKLVTRCFVFDLRADVAQPPRLASAIPIARSSALSVTRSKRSVRSSIMPTGTVVGGIADPAVSNHADIEFSQYRHIESGAGWRCRE